MTAILINPFFSPSFYFSNELLILLGVYYPLRFKDTVQASLNCITSEINSCCFQIIK